MSTAALLDFGMFDCFWFCFFLVCGGETPEFFKTKLLKAKKF